MQKLTDAIYEGTKTIKQYYIADNDLQLDYSKTGTTQYLVQTHGSSKFRPFTVQVSMLYSAFLVPDYPQCLANLTALQWLTAMQANKACALKGCH